MANNATFCAARSAGVETAVATGEEQNNNDMTFSDRNLAANITSLESLIRELDGVDGLSVERRGQNGGAAVANTPASPAPAAALAPPAAPEAAPAPAAEMVDLRDLTFYDDNHHAFACPRTPMPTPEQAAAGGVDTNASFFGTFKRKTYEENHFDSGTPKRQRLAAAGTAAGAAAAGAGSGGHLDSTQDIEAMINRKRQDMERAETEIQWDIAKVRSLMPIICGGTSLYPAPVQDAALISLGQMVNSRPSLAVLTFENHPDFVQDLDELTSEATRLTNQEVLASIAQLLIVFAEQCMNILFSGDNAKHFSSILKRFLRSEFPAVAAKARSLFDTLNQRPAA